VGVRRVLVQLPFSAMHRAKCTMQIGLATSLLIDFLVNPH